MAETKLNAAQADTLSALKSAGRPLSAYEVLDALRQTRATAAPPTAYRALARLIELGLAHRLESMNAYVACCGGHDETVEPAFSICDDCGTVEELTDPALLAPLAAAARAGGFEPVKPVIELHGRCAGCRGAA